MRVVQTQLAGYDGQLALLPERVTLCNAAGVHDDATAEHAVGLVLASLRGIPEAVRAHGTWTGLQEGRRSLADSRVLILGYGSIGRALADGCSPTGASSPRSRPGPVPTTWSAASTARPSSPACWGTSTSWCCCSR